MPNPSPMMAASRFRHPPRSSRINAFTRSLGSTSKKVVGPYHRAPHVRDRRAVKSESFTRLFEIPPDDVRELLRIDVAIVLKGIDVKDRDEARGHVPFVGPRLGVCLANILRWLVVGAKEPIVGIRVFETGGLIREISQCL